MAKEVKLFFGHSYEAVEDILKKYCDKMSPSGQKKPHPDPVKINAGLHISEISRIGANPKATQLIEDRTLTLVIVFVEKPTHEGLCFISSSKSNSARTYRGVWLIRTMAIPKSRGM